MLMDIILYLLQTIQVLYRQDWTYKDLIPYYEKSYGKKIRAVIPQNHSFTATTAQKGRSSVKSAMPGSLLRKAVSLL